MPTHHLTERHEVEASLEHPDLEPPSPSRSLGKGATLRLREQMARFADGSSHRVRRAAVVEILDSIDVSRVEPFVRRLTKSRVADGEIELEKIASTVPVDVVAWLIDVVSEGARVARSGSLSNDVALIAASIGAGVAVDEAVDAASSRVVEACGGWVDVGIAKASLLYQAYGATRSLIMNIGDTPAGSRRYPAVLVTERVAVDRLSLCGREMAPGDRVTIEIGAVGLEFGHGPHHCPGRDLAELIANAVAQEFADARYGSAHD